ncbi:MAG TPA: TetR/AcrR family transcriptional regulator [Ilumatobacteraceae bacterium]|nr:TetR/AcrR family transcriptional regulator [Ilumatobacteraceae bacterium]HRB01964.1 TetR/AcrR family transcriptional regulator [Ilumatobacteraceae bacterium]
MATSRREEIVAAATELFAQHGFHAVGMRAIADAVGIRGSSLYHYFPSKLDLLHAIAKEATTEFIETQLPSVAADPSRAASLRRLIREHILYFHDHRQEEAVGLRELQELRDNAPEQYLAFQKIRRSYQTGIEDIITAGIDNGEFVCDDAHLATLAILGMVNSVNDWFRLSGQYTIDDVASAYSELAVTRILGAD